jgi:hypothetical protein
MLAHQELAQAIVKAAELREESFDHGRAAQAIAAGGLVDMESFYRVSLREACDADGANPFLSYPVYLLLANSWNQALDWAQANLS